MKTTTINSNLLGKYIIVRWYDSGVWAWVLEWVEVVDGIKHIKLKDARMIWRFWANGGIALSSLSQEWLKKDCDSIKILNTISNVELMDERISTLLPCTTEVEKQIREYPVARQS